jgi:hypothetical protein
MLLEPLLWKILSGLLMHVPEQCSYLSCQLVKGNDLLYRNQLTHNLQPANSHKCMQLTSKTASVVPPEDGRLTPETCRGLRHNKVIVKLKVYEVGYIIVIHNDTWSTKYQTFV